MNDAKRDQSRGTAHEVWPMLVGCSMALVALAPLTGIGWAFALIVGLIALYALPPANALGQSFVSVAICPKRRESGL